MKKILISIALLFFYVTGNAQEPRQLTIGFSEKIPSAILKAERTIWIHLPEGYKAADAEIYPVIYVLDGEDQFGYCQLGGGRHASLKCRDGKHSTL